MRSNGRQQMRLHKPQPRSPERPIIVVASGMRGTGVTTISNILQSVASTLEIVDAGARWTDIDTALDRRNSRLLAVTTDDIVSVSSAYALIKLTREHYPDAEIDILVNTSDDKEALKIYERVQYAANRFLRETIGYAGCIPYDPDLGFAVAGAVQNLATKLVSEVHNDALNDVLNDVHFETSPAPAAFGHGLRNRSVL